MQLVCSIAHYQTDTNNNIIISLFLSPWGSQNASGVRLVARIDTALYIASEVILSDWKQGGGSLTNALPKKEEFPSFPRTLL